MRRPGVPEVWAAYDLMRRALNASVKLMDGVSPTRKGFRHVLRKQENVMIKTDIRR